MKFEEDEEIIKLFVVDSLLPSGFKLVDLYANLELLAGEGFCIKLTFLPLLRFRYSVMAAANQGNPETAQSVYEFNVKDIKGNDVSLDKYRGHVLIIVNVASKCGYTAKHYAELNELYDQYAESKGKLSSSYSSPPRLTLPSVQ